VRPPRITLDGALIVLVCIAGVTAAALNLRRSDADSGLPLGGVPEPQFGDEIQIVVMVSRECRACQVLGEQPIIDSLVQAVRGQAQAADLKTKLTGVAVDESWELGVDFLTSIGDFDEILAGRSWLNTGVVLFGHRDMPGVIGVPQVVVIRRNVSQVGERTVIDPDQLLARKVGLDELWEWQERGFPIRLGAPTQ